MIRPNWNQFKAKFKENAQTEFEWLCYFLFCQEFNKPFGIFRFKNHSGMETDPIKVGDDYISWEAKFYEDKLSDHTNDFIEKLKISKKKNPEVTKMYFYTPIDRTESSKKNQRKTTSQGTIEAEASKLDIEIVRKGASFFEIVCSHANNQQIATHCFSTDDDIIEFINKRQSHTESVLFIIQTKIVFNGKEIEINRDDLLSKIQESLTIGQVLIISGIGGVGKTALVKDFYNKINNAIPFYVFKASEFHVNSIDEIFKDITLQDFIEAHKDEENKIIVVDSAEKILDIPNTDPLKELLSVLIKNNWKIIFTARSSYLSDLDNELIDIYGITPSKFHIENISEEDLVNLSKVNKFNLPDDPKLIELIRNPFYLSEYLRFYKKEEKINYSEFKKKLWDKIIMNHKPSREICFLKMAFKRANDGLFFVDSCCESSVLDELVKCEVLGYETDGYFITHDIYEEWALEKIIESEFNKKSTNLSFLDSIGTSLAIRRAFRNWISEKLLLKDKSIEQFIEECIEDEKVESFRKDAVLISVLLSDYSEVFFELFKKKLLEADNELLKRLGSLLKIACKEVDDKLLYLLGIKNMKEGLKYMFTKPKGNGRKAIIKFIYDNLDEIGIENIAFILPITYDWNNKFHSGETTRLSSLIALRYYEWIVSKGGYFSRDDDNKKKLFRTILYGSKEIREELAVIFDNILKNNWNEHKDPYFDLTKTILSSEFSTNNLLMYYANMPDNYQLLKVHPKYILELANLFWFQHNKQERDSYSSSIMDMDPYFGLESSRLDYFPASSYQTPIYWLFESSLKETVDFILEFTNKCVEHLAKSEDQVKSINVYVDEGEPIKQYININLWTMYRGTQVSPHILESIHMALEKFFLEQGKKCDSNTLENWLIYLLRNSKSASISSVVTSIVLAYPEKTFNVAKILFQTKDFFLFDTSRFILDQQAKGYFGIGFGINSKNKIHEEERIKTCDDDHRKKSLEHLAFSYQIFRSEQVKEVDAEKRQKTIWTIIDKYYDELPAKNKQTESDKTWRLYLARMDSRKMHFKTTKTEKGIILHSEPQMDPQLKKHSETALKENSESMKYVSLGMWADNKINGSVANEQHKQYENNPKLVIKEVKEVIDKLRKQDDESFFLLNHAIPGNVCSVLVKYYLKNLSKKERIFCKNIIIDIASSSLKTNYQYQLSDGVGSSISVLPILLDEFTDEAGIIKTILLLTLMDPHQHFSDHSIGTILHNLWDSSFDNAQSLLFGYLSLEPEYKILRKSLREKNYKKGVYELTEKEVVEEFLKKYEIHIQKIIDNKISFNDLKDISKLDLYALRNAFLLIPRKTTDEEHKKIVQVIISVFAKDLLSKKREDRIDFKVKQDFFEKFTSFVLSSSIENIPFYLKPILDLFESSEAIADIFKEFISQEDRLNTYNNFWKIWEMFYKKVVALCKNSCTYWYTGEIIKGYLFARNARKNTASDWHSLKEENKNFFKKIAKDIGHCQSTLYSLAKLLNDIGSPYLEDGISWISSMLEQNKNLRTDKQDNDTIYFLENLIKKYVHKKSDTIKKVKKTKYEVLIILDFLVEKKSETGYLLREHIL